MLIKFTLMYGYMRSIKFVRSGSTVEFSLSKRHPLCQALFQTPNKNYPHGSGSWYKNEALGKNTIAKLMETIPLKAELLERYSNHCIRATAITTLFHQGVDAKQICAITKHKDERSLNHYINQTILVHKREIARSC